MRSIIESALCLTETVQAFRDRARAYFYEVMISGRACPHCEGPVRITGEGRGTCETCGATLDPTVAFQRCSACAGTPVLKIRRYVCGACGQEIRSRFLFDGMAFDAEYFRQKVAESRERKRELRERVRRMLAESRSNAIQLEALEPGDVADLFQALDGLTLEAFTAALPNSRSRFDLHRYQSHIQAHLQTNPLNLNQIPPLSEDIRLDRIWRFIAIIFLAHAGILDIRQAGESIMVIKREVDREGQGVPRDLEDADGIEEPVCRIEA